MDVSWLSVLCLGMMWNFLLHFYEPPSSGWIVLLLAAFGFGMLSVLRRETDKRGLREIRDAGRRSLRLCIFILAIQAAAMPFYFLWASRHHAETLFSPLVGALLNISGLRTVSDGGMLTVETPLRVISFRSTWEKAGGVYLYAFFLGSLVCLRMKKAKRKDFLFALIVVPIYAVLRYAFLLMLYATYSMHSLFWERILSFVSFLPLALLFARHFRDLPTPELPVKRKLTREDRIGAGIFFALAFAVVSFFGWRDGGIRKEGRVVVDEYHSDWEWTAEKYDENWFGERSGYNYYCFFNYLEQFYEVRRSMEPISSELLSKADVFILKTPTKPFSEEETEAILAYLESGGGLYLIGDHTNVFGTGSNLNQISRHFGIRFCYDCTYELVAGNLSEYDAPKLLPHPVVGRLPHFLFASSNTLDAPWDAGEVMIGYGLKTQPADYSQKNFFPEDIDSPLLSFGLFLQSAEVSVGEGRVLAFTDSTIFSNFWMYMKGKPELLLSSVEWLNHRNAMRMNPKHLSLFFGILLFFFHFVWEKKHPHTPAELLLAAGILAVLSGTLLFRTENRRHYPAPQPVREMTDIAFDREYSTFELPEDLHGFMAEPVTQLNTFYVWTQRLGYFPRTEEKLERALSESELAVVSKPDRPIRNSEAILAKVRSGGKLLIMDHNKSGAYSNSLLSGIGMEIVPAEMSPNAAYRDLKGIPLTGEASAVRGGEAWMRDERGNVICAVTALGEGIVAVFSDPDLFYNAHLGDVSANLNDVTELLTKLEFELLKDLVEQRRSRSNEKEGEQ